MKVVVAPNAFKGTLTASQAAAAIARGVHEALPSPDVNLPNAARQHVTRRGLHGGGLPPPC